MKNIKTTILGILTVCAIVIILGRVGWYETHYTVDATVIKTYRNTITVEDKDHNIWDFYGTGFSVGNRVKLIINTSHTDLEKYDDEVEQAIKY